MKEDTQKVVKCASCDKYFGYAEDNKNCPFCHTEYDGFEKVEGKPKVKKVTVKTHKESFKIWKDS